MNYKIFIKELEFEDALNPWAAPYRYHINANHLYCNEGDMQYGNLKLCLSKMMKGNSFPTSNLQ